MISHRLAGGVGIMRRDRVADRRGGVGAPGATAADLRAVFGAALPQVLAASSREILSAGPDVAALRARAARQGDQLREMLGES